MKNHQKSADTIRFLCADMVQKANSWHPWAPMWLADIITILSKKIKHNPKNPKWLNRDRLVFSGGHVSSLIYSYLYLTWYDISLDDLKKFRQLWSKTPWHPEYGEVPWVEITTWPLWQWVANAVWFAMAEKYAENLLNTSESKIIDHKIYCFCWDWDLQEWISYEACSIAWHQKLNNLILIYDSNNITIDWNTDITWDENVKQRFESQKWEVEEIDWHNFEEIEKSLENAKNSTKPYLIIAKTKIWKWCISLEWSSKTHWCPLWEEEIKISKQKAWFNPEKTFLVEQDILEEFRESVDRWQKEEKKWNELVEKSQKKELLKQLLQPDLENIIWPEFKENEKIATRSSNWKILNAISRNNPWFIWGSADLSPSNNTNLEWEWIFPNWKNIYFGIREHAMWAISNAISLYWLFTIFNATFFVFSDYLKASVRISALAKIKNYYIWTHDSIWVWEDWWTHQPIEHLTQFRALPNLYNFRPATAYENIDCWKVALKLDYPCSFILSRQWLVNRKFKEIIWEVKNWAYLVKKENNAKITLLASWSELELALNCAEALDNIWKKTNVVSMPCFDLFDEQDDEYKKQILDKNTEIIWIEASRWLELYKYCDNVIWLNSFWLSWKAEDLFEKFGLTVDLILEKIK